MVTITIDPESFGLGFIAGTSGYVAASGAGYTLFCAGKRIASLFRRAA